MVRIEPLLWRMGGETSRSVSRPHVKYSVAADTGIRPSVLPPIHFWLSDSFFPSVCLEGCEGNLGYNAGQKDLVQRPW